MGEGTYAIVYRGREKATGREVALKKIKLGEYKKDGVTFAAIREMKLLQELHHPNVIGLTDVFVHRQNIYCVNELAISDLEHVIMDKTVTFTDADIKSFMKMTLEGVAYLHANWVLHRVGDGRPNSTL